MNSVKKIISVVGARPNFMKIAPFCHEIDRYPDEFEHVLVHTGQHYDKKMSATFFGELEIPEPDINLEVGSDSHAVQTAKIMIAFEEVCLTHKPDWVVVVGDVNSTAACTLVAAKLNIKVAHIEAGLRSYDRTMPEEINRLVTDSLAELLLTPSMDANENLLKEGVDRKKIHFVGNIMIDTLKKYQNRADGMTEELLEKNRLNAMKSFLFVTLHRPSNVDHYDKLREIVDSLTRLSNELPIIFPIHPRTRQKMVDFNLLNKIENSNNIRLTNPMGYIESIAMIKSSKFIITDSGGVQEESTYLHTPCLTLRPNTERPVTITEGTNKLTTADTLWNDCQYLMNNHADNNSSIPELWDGETAKRIVEILRKIGE